jgi:hypothetical protein
MENPAAWTEAEKIINKAYRDWWEACERGMVGTSLAKTVADALRNAGLLVDAVQY